MIAGQRGFGAIVAIVVLVIMATLSAALVRLGTTQQFTSAQDLLSARAMQTARAGNEWGLYQALRSGNCVGAPGATLDLRAETGFSVTVTCTAQAPPYTSPPGPPYSFYEGETTPGVPKALTTYSIEAVACNSAACPDAALAVTPGYIERKRLVVANTP